MVIEIKQPETDDEYRRYFHLRWTLLRAPWQQPEGSETDEIEDQCFHLMAVDEDDKVIAVSRLQFNSESEAQVRYMAVAEPHERHGIGRALIRSMETYAGSLGIKEIVLDAREPAVGFYQKLGYDIIDKSYLLFDVIQHFRMTKHLL